jgi:proteasome lid subunit RPN8/RPN11
MEAKTQPVPGYYVWEVPGKPVAVHLHLGVASRLVAEVTLGQAARKRGAEVCGVLIGTIERGDTSIVRVEDFEPVENEDADGPASFQDACSRWQPDESRSAYAVGYFRSRAGHEFLLTPRDLGLLDRFFPSPWHVALLIEPSANVRAGFFFREDGAFQRATPLEFSLGRRLAIEEAPPRRRGRDTRTLVPEVVAAEEEIPAKKRLRGGWVWIPLCFIFLLLGVLLGFQFALTIAPRLSQSHDQVFSLGLAVSKTGNNLSVKWDREAPAVRAAMSGVLDIADGSYTKSVALDTAQLQNGSILYRNSSNAIKFRLIVYPNTGVSVTETIEWKQ